MEISADKWRSRFYLLSRHKSSTHQMETGELCDVTLREALSIRIRDIKARRNLLEPFSFPFVLYPHLKFQTSNQWNHFYFIISKARSQNFNYFNMRFTSVTAAAIGFFAASTSATLALGKQGGKNVAWIEGDEVCGGTVSINSQSDNPCGIPFKLRNGYTYSVCNSPARHGSHALCLRYEASYGWSFREGYNCTNVHFDLTARQLWRFRLWRRQCWRRLLQRPLYLRRWVLRLWRGESLALLDVPSVPRLIKASMGLATT